MTFFQGTATPGAVMLRWLTHCLLETFKPFLVSLSWDKQDEMFTVSSLGSHCHHCLAVPSDYVSLWSFWLLVTKELYTVYVEIYSICFYNATNFSVFEKKKGSLCFDWVQCLIWEIILFDCAVSLPPPLPPIGPRIDFQVLTPYTWHSQHWCLFKLVELKGRV